MYFVRCEERQKFIQNQRRRHRSAAKNVLVDFDFAAIVTTFRAILWQNQLIVNLQFKIVDIIFFF